MAYDISVLVCTYNPDLKKTEYTLKSILLQQDVRCQIVIADDGSKENHKQEIENFLKNEGCTDYAYQINEVNGGTVKNIISGLNHCQAEYVKLISPGDCLHGSTALADWLKFVKANDSSVSFSDYICYYIDEAKDNHINTVETIQWPNYPEELNKGHDAALREYIFMEDNGLGAATICKTDALLKYLNMAAGKVIYAEDAVYRVMIASGETVSYYNRPCVLYEYGTGISTPTNDAWNKKIAADFAATNVIMEGLFDNNPQLKNEFKYIAAYKANPTKLNKALKYMHVKGLLNRKSEKNQAGIKKTCTEFDKAYLQDVGLPV